jgi:hypothetical protein
VARSGTTTRREWANENTEGRQYPLRALQALEPSYRRGTLLLDMTSWLPTYSGQATPQFAAMVDMTWHGVRTWEEVLLMPGQPWTPHITPAQRRVLRRVVNDCKRAARGSHP